MLTETVAPSECGISDMARPFSLTWMLDEDASRITSSGAAAFRSGSGVHQSADALGADALKEAHRCSACCGGRLVQNATPKITVAPKTTSAAFQLRAPARATCAAQRLVEKSNRFARRQADADVSRHFLAPDGSSSNRSAIRGILAAASSRSWLPASRRPWTSCRHSAQRATCRAMRQRSQRPRSPPANSAICAGARMLS